MRLSSPTMAAAFVDGAREQGADVVDYGMLGTDMMYFAVCRDGLDGGAQITASHNPKQYNGMKLVRARGVPALGRRRHQRHARDDPEGHDPRACRPEGRARRRADVLDDYVEKVLSFIDPGVVKPFNVVLDAGSGMGGLVAPKLFDRLPCKTTKLCFEIDGTFPNHEANPAHRGEPPGHHRARDRGEGRHRHRVGRRRRPLLLHRRQRRVRGRRLRHGAARRGVPDQVARREDRLRRARQLRREGHRREVRRQRTDEPRRPRVLQAAHARGERGVRRRGHGTLLLPRLLLRGQRLHSRRCCSSS